MRTLGDYVRGNSWKGRITIQDTTRYSSLDEIPPYLLDHNVLRIGSEPYALGLCQELQTELDGGLPVCHKFEKAKVIFNPPATILYKDGKKYVSKCDSEDTFDEEKGLMLCLLKSHGYTYSDIERMLDNAKRTCHKATLTKEGKKLFQSNEFKEAIKEHIEKRKKSAKRFGE